MVRMIKTKVLPSHYDQSHSFNHDLSAYIHRYCVSVRTIILYGGISPESRLQNEALIVFPIIYWCVDLLPTLVKHHKALYDPLSPVAHELSQFPQPNPTDPLPPIATIKFPSTGMIYSAKKSGWIMSPGQSKSSGKGQGKGQQKPQANKNGGVNNGTRGNDDDDDDDMWWFTDRTKSVQNVVAPKRLGDNLAFISQVQQSPVAGKNFPGSKTGNGAGLKVQTSTNVKAIVPIPIQRYQALKRQAIWDAAALWVEQKYGATGEQIDPSEHRNYQSFDPSQPLKAVPPHLLAPLVPPTSTTQSPDKNQSQPSIDKSDGATGSNSNLKKKKKLPPPKVNNQNSPSSPSPAPTPAPKVSTAPTPAPAPAPTTPPSLSDVD